jgi:hypothetical protein
MIPRNNGVMSYEPDVETEEGFQEYVRWLL